MKIDYKFEELFFKEDIIKQGDKLPYIIKNSLNKGKYINEHWKENKLNSLINDCLNIEKNIENIKKINKKMKKNNSINVSLNFYPKEDGINLFLESIKNFGTLGDYDTNIDFDQDLVKSWLNNRNFKSELLFIKSRDGSTFDDFHKKCYNKGNNYTHASETPPEGTRKYFVNISNHSLSVFLKDVTISKLLSILS